MTEAMGAFGRIAKLAFRESYGVFSPLVYILFLLVRPMTQVLFFGLAARFATGNPDVTFQVVGNAVQVCALSSLLTVADVLVNERANGTLSLVTLAAKNRFMIFGGRLLVVGSHGLVSSTAALAVGALIFGVDLSQVHWPALVLSLVVTVMATSALGVALGGVGLVLRDLNLVGNILMVGMMAICGIQFPVTQLPGWLQVVAYSLPMTRGAAAARLAMAGGGPEVWSLLGTEALVGCIWLVVGYGLYLWLERKARVYGTLDLY
ncbi:MAG TPA: ABC transporter permease [Symbiobacteriaceae bacterium]|nr:ABC transporter permease [Symbiobacteriaceae bacterium]